jgi:hypothetical protein
MRVGLPGLAKTRALVFGIAVFFIATPVVMPALFLL